MKRPFDAKRFWEFLRDWKFCVPFCLVVTAALVWIGVVLWRRWQVAALIIGILIMLAGGCKGVRLFKAS